MSSKSPALELPCVTRHCLLHAALVLNSSDIHQALPKAGLQKIERFCGELSQITQLGKKGISLPDPLLLQTIHIHKFAEGAITAEEFTKLIEQQLLKVTLGNVKLDLDALQRLCWRYYEVDKRSAIAFPRWLSPECTYRLWLIFNTVTDYNLVISVSQNTVNEVVKRLIELCGYTWNSGYQYTRQKMVEFPEYIEAITDYFDQLHLDTSLTCEVIASLVDEVVNGVIRKGHLKKKGHKRKNWLKRWFVLQKTTLHYYETRESSKPKGQLVLNGTTEVQSIPDIGDKKYQFLVTCGHTGVPFQICADDQKAKQEWILAIRKAIALAKVIEGSSSTKRDSFTESVSGFYLLKYGTRAPTLSRHDSDLKQHMTLRQFQSLSDAGTGIGAGGERTRQSVTSTSSGDEPLEEYVEMKPGVVEGSHDRNTTEKYTGQPYEIPLPLTIPPGGKPSLRRATSIGSAEKPPIVFEPRMEEAPTPVAERHKRDTLESIDSGRGSIDLESPPPLPSREENTPPPLPVKNEDSPPPLPSREENHTPLLPVREENHTPLLPLREENHTPLLPVREENHTPLLPVKEENKPPPLPAKDEDSPPPLPSREEYRRLIRNSSVPDTRGDLLQTALTGHLSHREKEQPPIPPRRVRSQSSIPQSFCSPIREHSPPAVITPGPTSQKLSSDAPRDTPPTPPPRLSQRHQTELTRNVPPPSIVPDEKPPPVPRHRSYRSTPPVPYPPGPLDKTATLPPARTISDPSEDSSENIPYDRKSPAADQPQGDRPIPKPRAPTRSKSSRFV